MFLKKSGESSFGPYIFTSVNLLSSITKSNKIKFPCPSFFILITLYSKLLLNKMQTPLEFDVYELKYTFPPHSARMYGSKLSVKCVSWRQQI